MSQELNARLEFAKSIAQQAGKYALEHWKTPKSIEFKTPKDIVTEVDLACDQMIRDAIHEAFPSDNLLSEENPLLDQGSEWTWVIDPIDGTVNYSRQIPLWGVAVAIVQGDQVVAGAQFLPVFDELYWAIEGGGAWVNESPISVSQTTELHQFVISNGDFNVGDEAANNIANLQTFEKEAQLAQRIKCIGSAIVETSWVASNKVDAYVMQYSHLWDICVGDILVREAGGQVSHLNGDKLGFIDGCSVLFSNGKCHEEIVEKITG